MIKWAKMVGGSEKQLTDATRVYETQYDRLDMAYIRRWVETLQLVQEWNKLLADADPI